MICRDGAGDGWSGPGSGGKWWRRENEFEEEEYESQETGGMF
jgi:hypothetical protein